MHYVYLIESLSFPGERYVGFTMISNSAFPSTTMAIRPIRRRCGPGGSSPMWRSTAKGRPRRLRPISNQGRAMRSQESLFGVRLDQVGEVSSCFARKGGLRRMGCSILHRCPSSQFCWPQFSSLSVNRQQNKAPHPAKLALASEAGPPRPAAPRFAHADPFKIWQKFLKTPIK
jgi:hypothetical protein